METTELEYVLVPAGLLVLLAYHGWLLYSILYNPKRTVIGLNAERRHQWVHSLMADPLKNGVLAVQTLRNNLMASTQLATIAITLSSLITALVSSSESSSSSVTTLRFLGVTVTYSFTDMSSKYFAVLLCFLLAFFCNMQAIRYYAHVSFLVTSVSSQGKAEYIEFVARHLSQGSIFWSLGMRAFYLAFPLLLWIFGCIPMFVCCIVLTFVLYFLDTTNHFTKDLKNCSLEKDNASQCDTESATNTCCRCNGSGSSATESPPETKGLKWHPRRRFLHVVPSPPVDLRMCPNVRVLHRPDLRSLLLRHDEAFHERRSELQEQRRELIECHCAATHRHEQRMKSHTVLPCGHCG